MNERSAKHATFVIERNYAASPAQVFAAWADPTAKARWFPKADTFDFRVGGQESSRGGPAGGPVYSFDAQYQEIVPERRIVYSYVMDQDDTRIVPFDPPLTEAEVSALLPAYSILQGLTLAASSRAIAVQNNRQGETS
jgi:uncharacterized protein YndB with AHSA1/START domain